MGTKLLQLCQALDAGDFVMATHLQARPAPWLPLLYRPVLPWC